jgi:translation initiation factor IF-2
MRVYELARELNLENKDVLTLCEQLGISGKSSHSSAISDSDCDKVRKFILKSNVTEVDKEREVKIEGQLVREKRVSGNVIRRRKKGGEDGGDAEEPILSASAESESSIHEPIKESFNTDESVVSQPKIEVAEEITSDADAVSEEVQVEVEEEIIEPVIPEEVMVDGYSSGDLDEIRKKLDVRAPKVLGRIDLPTSKLPVKKVVKEAGTSDAATTDDGDSGKPGAKKKGKRGVSIELDRDSSRDAKKGKKKQILSKNDLLDYDGEKDLYRGKKDKKSKKALDPLSAEALAARANKKPIKIHGEMTVGEIAHQMGLKASQVIAELFKLGTMVSINQLLDFDTATIIAQTFGFDTQNTETSSEDLFQGLVEADNEADVIIRPPVVTVMGHVDHGKTSLLDCIRKTSVTTGEAGGITQHIGAYNVVLPSGGSVTFLDTPGHEAFTSMRSRGAKVTDIVVLVVAADDGVMPQTIEAINHAKAAGVPIIVAINKMDKAGANPDKVINQLSEHGLVPEDWGGDTLMVRVSAHTKDGIDTLLETLHLQADILELKANPKRPAHGTVIESRVDKGRGPILTVLVQNGTLKKGDIFVAGSVSGRVRAISSYDGRIIEEAGPSIPVEVLGASTTADAGDDFAVTIDETQARFIADERLQRKRKRELANQSQQTGFGLPLTMERFSEIVVSSAEVKDLPLIVKVDVQGSMDAVVNSLGNLSNDEVKVKIIHKAVGAVSENDTQLAIASNAIIIGFNVRADGRAQSIIEQEGLPVLYSRIIYELVDAVKDALKGKMAPKFQEKVLGRVEVRDTFKVPRQGVVAGSYVLDGTIARGAHVRLLRDGIIVHEGKMSSLRRFKDDVKEVQAGYECGIGIDGYSDIKNGDIIEVFKVEQIAL